MRKQSMHFNVGNPQDVNSVYEEMPECPLLAAGMNGILKMFLFYLWHGKEQFVTSGVVKNCGGNQDEPDWLIMVGHQVMKLPWFNLGKQK